MVDRVGRLSTGAHGQNNRRRTSDDITTRPYPLLGGFSGFGALTIGKAMLTSKDTITKLINSFPSFIFFSSGFFLFFNYQDF